MLYFRRSHTPVVRCYRKCHLVGVRRIVTVYIPATKNESITNRKAMYGTVLHRIEMCSLGPHIRIQQPTSAGPPTVILSMLQVYTLKFSDPNWVVVPLKTNPHSLPFRTKTSLTLTTVDRGVLSPSCPPLEELASKSSIRNQFVCVAIVHDVIFNSAAGNQRLVLQPWNANPTESGRIDTGIRVYKHNTGYMCGESVPLVALVHGRAQMCSRSRKGKLPTLSSSRSSFSLTAVVHVLNLWSYSSCFTTLSRPLQFSDCL